MIHIHIECQKLQHRAIERQPSDLSDGSCMSLADIRPRSEIVEVIFKIGALVLAGGWTIFGYIVLRQRDKAAADLRTAQLTALNLELQMRRLPVIRVEIVASVHRGFDDVGPLILVDVNLTNCGSIETRIKWSGEPPALTVRHAAFGPDGKSYFVGAPIELRVPRASDPSVEATSHVIRPGATERIGFAVRVERLGVYLLSFRGVTAPEDRQLSDQVGTDPRNTIAWTATRYVVVADPANAAKAAGTGL